MRGGGKARTTRMLSELSQEPSRRKKKGTWLRGIDREGRLYYPETQKLSSKKFLGRVGELDMK